jgi:hypothetical protein
MKKTDGQKRADQAKVFRLCESAADKESCFYYHFSQHLRFTIIVLIIYIKLMSVKNKPKQETSSKPGAKVRFFQKKSRF